MSRHEHVQFNVRSAYARARAQELARQTGMTATQIVEDALRAYVPPGATPAAGRLVRRGPILVKPAEGRRVSLAEAEKTLEAIRERKLED